MWNGSAWVFVRWKGSAWVPPGSSSAAGRLLIALSLAFSLVMLCGAAGLFLIDTVDMDHGCGSIDPTDPANYSVVWIDNDTAKVVSVGNGQGAYCSFPATLGPGQKVTVDASCDATGAQMTSYALTSNGQPIGYIAVDTPRKHDGLVFDVSDVSRSRSVPTPVG
jgi:hypothetical protein